jgi:hypothetical protein
VAADAGDNNDEASVDRLDCLNLLADDDDDDDDDEVGSNDTGDPFLPPLPVLLDCAGLTPSENKANGS